MKWLISTALVVCLAGCATPHREGLTYLTIVQRPIYGICAGYCPDVDVVVVEDGQITVSKHRLNEPDELKRMHVTPRQAAQFSRMLAPYRPKLHNNGPVECPSWNSTDPLVLKVHRYRIVWTDA